MHHSYKYGCTNNSTIERYLYIEPFIMDSDPPVPPCSRVPRLKHWYDLEIVKFKRGHLNHPNLISSYLCVVQSIEQHVKLMDEIP